jgi:hypothetical protein
MLKNTMSVALIITALALSGCSDYPDKKYTATQYSISGEQIGKWNNVLLRKGRDGWVIIKLPNGKDVLIDGPHRLEEE